MPRAAVLTAPDPEFASQAVDDCVTLRLAELMGLDGEYDSEFLAPSQDACGYARATLERVAHLSSAHLDLPVFSATGDGGLILQWKVGPGVLRLLVPSDPARAFIYYRSPVDDGIQEEVDPETLLRRLVWLSGG